MNWRLISVLSAAMITFATTVAVPAEAKREPADSVAQLIRKLPNADYLPPCYRLPKGVRATPDGPVLPPGLSDEAKEAVKKELDLYRKNIAALSLQFAKLKEHLKPGRSVFAYPGLLAKGGIRYDETKKRYRMMLGVYDEVRHAGSQGRFGPYWVAFDDQGRILAVEDVVYSH